MDATSLTTNGTSATPVATVRDDPGRTEFLAGMAAAPSAVTVVVHENEDGIIGQTISAFTSVCADPPTLLVCVNKRSPLHHRLSFFGGRFSVNLLGQEQSAIADRFAGRPTDGSAPYDVDGTAWDIRPSGIRTIRGAAAVFECELLEHLPNGTHGIFIARVTATHNDSGDVRGLVYCARGYRRLV